jgi:hypothetical protein
MVIQRSRRAGAVRKGFSTDEALDMGETLERFLLR